MLWVLPKKFASFLAGETESEDVAPPGSPANPVPVFDESRNQSRLTSVVEDAAPPPAKESNGSAHLKEEKPEVVKAKVDVQESEESVVSSPEAEKPQYTKLASAPVEAAKAAVNGHAVGLHSRNISIDLTTPSNRLVLE